MHTGLSWVPAQSPKALHYLLQDHTIKLHYKAPRVCINHLCLWCCLANDTSRNQGLRLPSPLGKVFILKDSLKMCQKDQFLNHAVTRRKAKQKERPLYLEFRKDWTDQNAINILHLLVVPLDFVLTLAKMKRKWAQITAALSWLCCAGLNSHTGALESRTFSAPLLFPLEIPCCKAVLCVQGGQKAREFFDIAFKTKHTQCSRCNGMLATMPSVLWRFKLESQQKGNHHSGVK